MSSREPEASGRPSSAQPSGSSAGNPYPGRRTGPRPATAWPTGRLFSAVARRIERDWNAHLAHWDLNHASLPVLYLLAGGPRSQRELALASGVTEQTMSRIIARLERTGYVRRSPHADDRRRHEVHLLEPGRSALAEAGDPRAAEEMSMRGLSAEQREQLRGLLMVMIAERPRAGDTEIPAPEDEAHQETGTDAR